MVAAPSASSPSIGSHENAEPLDPSTIARLRTTSASLLARLIEAFASYAPPAAVALRTAVATGDAAAAMTAVHSLKSSSANVAALPLAEMCRRMEVRLRAGGDGPAAAMAEDAEAVERELTRVLCALAAIKAGLPVATRSILLAG